MRSSEVDASMSTLKREAMAAPLLREVEEIALVERMRRGDPRALDRLVRAHMRLAIANAKEFSRRSGLPASELVGEAFLALVLAARRFELGHRLRFGGYAIMWIQSLLRRYTLANRRIVRAPSNRSGRKLLASLSAVERKVAQKRSGEVEAAAVAEELGVTAAEVHAARAALRGRDVPYDPARDELLPSLDESPEALVAKAEERQQQKQLLTRLMKDLEPRERAILCTRYLGDTQETLDEVGRHLGLTGERVRQLEKIGCEKLRTRVAHMADAEKAA